MADPLLLLGNAVIVPTGGLTLAWTAVVTDGSTTTTLNSSDGADPILTAGTYSPDGFINHVSKQLRNSLFTRLSADAWVTTDPVEANITLKIGTPSVGPLSGVGATPLRLKCDSLGGALKAGVEVTIQSFSLVNTNNNWCWLGLCYPGETRALSCAGGDMDDTGRFQPRWLHFFRATYRDTGDYLVFPGHYSEVLDDGTVFQYGFGGGPIYQRDMTLVTLPQHIAGSPWMVGRWGAFGATRELLNYVTQDETLFTGISNTHKRTDNLTTPAYLQSGRWWARYRDDTGTAFRCFDVWPSSITPKVGSPIQVYPEAIAMVEEWRRTGLLFRYETADQTAGIQWVSKAYAPNKKGAWEVRPVKRGNTIYYDLDLSMVLITNPGLATP